MRKAVVSGVLVAGLLMAQVAMAADGIKAQIRALHQQEKTLKVQLHENPSQTPAILAQIRALRKQERTLRQSDIKAKMAAKQAARKS